MEDLRITRFNMKRPKKQGLNPTILVGSHILRELNAIQICSRPGRVLCRIACHDSLPALHCLEDIAHLPTAAFE